MDPSLRPALPELAEAAWVDGSKLARSSLALHGEAEAAEGLEANAPYTPEQLLDEDWFPPSRSSVAQARAIRCEAPRRVAT